MLETRRLFIKSYAAFLAPGGEAQVGPNKSYTLTAEERGLPEDVVRLPHLLRYLDECGAEYSACPGRYGWYKAVWRDPDLGSEPIIWECSVDPSHVDHRYACLFFALSGDRPH